MQKAVSCILFHRVGYMPCYLHISGVCFTCTNRVQGAGFVTYIVLLVLGILTDTQTIYGHVMYYNKRVWLTVITPVMCFICSSVTIQTVFSTFRPPCLKFSGQV